MKRIKPILVIVEHIVLISLLSGAVGFYLGNQYGSGHVDVKSLKTASTQATTLKQ